MPVQISYQINPDVGFPGLIAEPTSPHRVEIGVLNIPAAATRTAPRPGDSLFYNTTNNGWEVPETAATRLDVSGILSYRKDDVANAASFVQYEDGDEIEIVTMGVVWIVAGQATERGDNLAMQADWKYDVVTRQTTVATLYKVPIQNYSRDAAVDGSIIKAAIGYGRAI